MFDDTMNETTLINVTTNELDTVWERGVNRVPWKFIYFV
jgi:hypothetical protein